MTAPGDRLLGPPAADVVAVAAACARRVLEREGIPMFLALHDARPGRDLAVRDAGAPRGGRPARGAARRVRAPRSPAGRSSRCSRRAAPRAARRGRGSASQWDPELDHDPEEAALIEALVVLADQHLRARP